MPDAAGQTQLIVYTICTKAEETKGQSRGYATEARGWAGAFSTFWQFLLETCARKSFALPDE